MVRKLLLFLFMCINFLYCISDRKAFKEKAAEQVSAIVNRELVVVMKIINKLSTKKRNACMQEIYVFEKKLKEIFSKSTLSNKSLVHDRDTNIEYKNALTAMLANITSIVKGKF